MLFALLRLVTIGNYLNNNGLFLTALIEFVNLFGLLLLLGGASYRHTLWRNQDTENRIFFAQVLLQRSVAVMVAGLLLVVIARLATLTHPAIDSALLLLAGLFFITHLFGERRNSLILRIVALSAAAGVIVLQVTTSHSADEPGVLPLISDALHLLGATIWGGSLLHLVLQPWPALIETRGEQKNYVAGIATRYALTALVVLALLTLSGGLLAFVHIHNIDALGTSAYGTAFQIKAVFAVLLAITMSVNLLRIAPACRTAAKIDAGDRLPIMRFRRMCIVETLLLTGLLLATAALNTRSPPGVAPFLNPQSWQLTVGEIPMRIDLQPVAGRASQARLEMSATDPDHRFAEGTRLVFSAHNHMHDAGSYDVEALPIGPASFLGEVVFAMPGEWKIDLSLQQPDREPLSAVHAVTLPGPPLQNDIRAYLNLSTVSYSRIHTITFIVGLLLFIVAAWTIRLSFKGKAPLWVMPFAIANIAMGGYLFLSVLFVKTYPSSFWTNPQPYTVEVIQRGDTLYRTHCADCHGLAGKGDGPWAVQNRGSIPDLTAPHMDSHTDGEILWWIQRGIPSLDMPSLGDKLSEDDTWRVINFVRSLRHGMPAPD